MSTATHGRGTSHVILSLGSVTVFSLQSSLVVVVNSNLLLAYLACCVMPCRAGRSRSPPSPGRSVRLHGGMNDRRADSATVRAAAGLRLLNSPSPSLTDSPTIAVVNCSARSTSRASSSDLRSNCFNRTDGCRSRYLAACSQLSMDRPAGGPFAEQRKPILQCIGKANCKLSSSCLSIESEDSERCGCFLYRK